MRLLTIVSVVLNMLLAIAMAQALARAQKTTSFRGKLVSFDECQWTIGDKQQLAIYAEDFDLCGALMALPAGASVSLSW